MFSIRLLRRMIVLIAIIFLLTLLIPASAVFATTYVVSKTADTGDGTCNADCSLREAVDAANASPGADTITVPAGTYSLILGALPDITTDMTINGAGAGLTIISGIDVVRPFNVKGTAVISGVTVTHGLGTFGGGIRVYSASSLTLIDSLLTGNSVDGYGGGIMNYGTLVVKGTTFTDNHVAGVGIAGGGLGNAGTAFLINSTLTSNSSVIGGGAIFNQSTMTVINSTVSGNTATAGDSIFNSDGTLTLQNSIIATTSGRTNCHVDAGTISDGGNNIDSETSCGFGVTSFSSTDPLLSALANNGGSTQTMALLPGSKAINGGNNALAVDQLNNALTADQRGAGFPRNVGGTVDIGAYEATLGPLDVHLTLQGRTGPAHDPSRVVTARVQIFTQDGGTMLTSATYGTDDTSFFSIPNLPTGTYLFRVKGTHTLARDYILPIIPGVGNLTTGQMLEGDASDNNGVNISDFAILASAFGKAEGAQGYDARSGGIL